MSASITGSLLRQGCLLCGKVALLVAGCTAAAYVTRQCLAPNKEIAKIGRISSKKESM
jgi:hypothetical protein